MTVSLTTSWQWDPQSSFSAWTYENGVAVPLLWNPKKAAFTPNGK